MDNYVSLGGAFVVAVGELWRKILGFLPNFLIAIFVLIVGLIIASILGGVAKRLLRLTRIDDLSQKLGVSSMLSRLGMRFTFADAIGWIVKWFFIIVTLILMADTLHWVQITQFLNSVVLYIPNVIIAVIIAGIGLVAGHALFDIVRTSVEASKISTAYADILASMAKWAVIIFSFFAALVQLGIAASLIQILFSGMVFALALSFGLGGREKATQLINQIDKITGSR